jgi:methylenetetrahydrofolate dehydrogenase (NADP+)/methenyltetrahydrofolate cyclohydrolase
MLINLGATVTVCNSKTKNLEEICRQADILISATGRAGLICAEMVKRDAVVIDVGINRGGDGKLCGDVDYINVCDKASCITPVPGGVGPMTIVMLMKNTITAAKNKN